ncbi:MAG TPA: Uma2 family endonuclease [Vicinamibacteria bacterium]|nr:Uma2 family endonuclease [Vicinamibacteria bacterium]
MYEALRGRASVYKEDPLRAEGIDSEPEPDVMVCSHPEISAYGTERTEPLVVIEVADSSLEYDLGEKGDLYAQAGVPEYWVVNLVERVLEVFREPENGSYRRRSSLELGSRITPEAWPDLELDVASFFPTTG